MKLQSGLVTNYDHRKMNWTKLNWVRMPVDCLARSLSGTWCFVSLCGSLLVTFENPLKIFLTVSVEVCWWSPLSSTSLVNSPLDSLLNSLAGSLSQSSTVHNDFIQATGPAKQAMIGRHTVLTNCFPECFSLEHTTTEKTKCLALMQIELMEVCFDSERISLSSHSPHWALYRKPPYGHTRRVHTRNCSFTRPARKCSELSAAAVLVSVWLLEHTAWTAARTALENRVLERVLERSLTQRLVAASSPTGALLWATTRVAIPYCLHHHERTTDCRH